MGEIANIFAILCGGSINDKIYAAFNLFDQNDSMTLSFDELKKFTECVFQMFYFMKDQPELKQKEESESSIWNTV